MAIMWLKSEYTVVKDLNKFNPGERAVSRNSRHPITVKSILKAVEILKSLSHGNRKLTDISRDVNQSKSTVHRLLQALKESGMVHQDPMTEEYYQGTLLFELASDPLVAHQSLIYCAHPKMEDLRRATGETIALEIKSGIEQIRLHRLIGTHSVAFLGAPSIIQLLLPGASGKALLSQVTESELRDILDNIELVKLTPYTVTDKQAYSEEIIKAKQRGYATSYDEVEVGVIGISVPVLNYTVPASMTILGPKDRLTPRIMDLVDEAKRKAGEISQQLLSRFNH
jgi:DNA-binding IclR family transcriptional regulator